MAGSSTAGEAGRWQITQAAQGAPWSCSPQAGVVASAVSQLLCCARGWEGSPKSWEGRGLCPASAAGAAWWCVSAVWLGAKPCAMLSGAATMEAMPPMGKLPMAMASPARPRRASKHTRKKVSTRSMHGMIRAVRKSSAELVPAAPACYEKSRGRNSRVLWLLCRR